VSALTLLGPNGAGKTTTLLMLLGVITPDAGEIEVVGLGLPRPEQGDGAGRLRRRLPPLPERLRVDSS
jgi:ABC-2 type transport system ATP-binding protein